MLTQKKQTLPGEPDYSFQLDSVDSVTKKKKKKKKKKLLSTDEAKNNDFNNLAKQIYYLRSLISSGKTIFIFNKAFPKDSDNIEEWTLWIKSCVEARTLPDLEFYSELIPKLIILNPALAWELYEIFLKFYKIQSPVINKLIIFAGQNGRLDLAINFYIDAIQYNQVNSEIFDSMLQVAIIYDYELAKKIYLQASTFPIPKKDPKLIAVTGLDEKKTSIEESQIEAIFQEVGLEEKVINQMYLLCKNGAYFTGKVSALIGFILNNHVDEAKQIILNDNDCVQRSTNIAHTSLFLKDNHDFKIKRKDYKKRWIKMKKIVDGMPFDLTVANEKTYDGEKFVSGIISGKMYVFLKEEVVESKISNRFDFLLYKNKYYFAIDKTHPDYLEFKYACQTFEYWLVDYRPDINYLKIALKNQLFWENIRKEKISTRISGKIIRYRNLLLKLPNHFITEISSTDPKQRRRKRKACYKALYRVLDLVKLDHEYAKIHMCAMIKALILTHPDVQINNVAYCEEILQLQIDLIYNNLKNVFYEQNQPSSAMKLGEQLEFQVNSVFSDNKESCFTFLDNSSNLKYFSSKYQTRRIPEMNAKYFSESNYQNNTINISSNLKSIENLSSDELKGLERILNEHDSLIRFSQLKSIILGILSLFNDSIEFRKLTLLSKEDIIFPDNNNRPLIIIFNDFFHKVIPLMDRLLDTSVAALTYLETDIYFTLSKLCLNLVSGFNESSTNIPLITSIQITNITKNLVHYIDQIKNTKKDNIKQNIGFLIYQKINEFLSNNSNLMFCNIQLYHVLAHVLPWINKDKAVIKKTIVCTIQDIFSELYKIFSYIERGLLINTVDNNLDIYQQTQQTLLQKFLFPYHSFLEKCKVKRVKKLIRYNFNVESFVEIIDNSIIPSNSLDRYTNEQWLDLEFIKSTLEKNYNRNLRISEKNESLKVTKKILFEITKIYNDYYQSSYTYGKEFVNTIHTFNAGLLIKIDELIKLAKFDNELLLPHLYSLKFQILLNRIILNTNNPIRSLSLEIHNLALFIRSFTTASQLEKISKAEKCKEHEVYFNNLNMNSSLIQLAIGIQRLLHFTLLVSKNMIHANTNVVRSILESICTMMEAQLSILSLMKDLGNNTLFHWIFMDKNSQIYTYSAARLYDYHSEDKQQSFGVWALLNIEPIFITSNKIFYEAKQLKEKLMTGNLVHSKVFPILAGRIITKLAELREHIISQFAKNIGLNNLFLFSRSIAEDLGLECEVKDEKQSCQIQEELKKSIHEFNEALDIRDKNLLKQIAQLEKEQELISEENYNSFPELEKIPLIKIKQASKIRKLPTEGKDNFSKKYSKGPMHVPNVSTVYLYESPPSLDEKTNISWKKMRELFLQAIKIINQATKPDFIDQIKILILQIEQEIKVQKGEVFVIKCWFVRDIYAHTALHYIKKDDFFEANLALAQADKEYLNICAISEEDRLKYNKLLDATLNHADDLLKLYLTAKNVLEKKIINEKICKDIIAEKDPEWWHLQRYQNGYTDRFGVLHLKDLSDEAKRFRKLICCYKTLQMSSLCWVNNKMNLKNPQKNNENLLQLSFSQFNHFFDNKHTKPPNPQSADRLNIY